MLRILLLALCIIGSTQLSAQNTKTAVKTTENQAENAIDYKQMGAPMPPLGLITFHDTTSATELIDGVAPPKPAPKKKKKRRADEVDLGEMKYISSKQLDNGYNLFVMMFNPTCSHCEDETQLLEKNMDLFKNTNVVLLANKVMKPYLPNFTKTFKIDDYPKMHIGADSLGFIDKVFLYQALPQINIYSGDRKLLKTFTGEVSIDSLKQYIQ